MNFFFNDHGLRDFNNFEGDKQTRTLFIILAEFSVVSVVLDSIEERDPLATLKRLAHGEVSLMVERDRSELYLPLHDNQPDA